MLLGSYDTYAYHTENIVFEDCKVGDLLLLVRVKSCGISANFDNGHGSVFFDRYPPWDGQAMSDTSNDPELPAADFHWVTVDGDVTMTFVDEDGDTNRFLNHPPPGADQNVDLGWAWAYVAMHWRGLIQPSSPYAESPGLGGPTTFHPGFCGTTEEGSSTITHASTPTLPWELSDITSPFAHSLIISAVCLQGDFDLDPLYPDWWTKVDCVTGLQSQGGHFTFAPYEEAPDHACSLVVYYAYLEDDFGDQFDYGGSSLGDIPNGVDGSGTYQGASGASNDWSAVRGVLGLICPIGEGWGILTTQTTTGRFG